MAGHGATATRRLALRTAREQCGAATAERSRDRLLSVCYQAAAHSDGKSHSREGLANWE